DGTGLQRGPHDGLGLLAEDRGVVGQHDGIRRGAVGAGAKHAAGQRRQDRQDPAGSRALDHGALGLLDGHPELRGHVRADRAVKQRQAEPFRDRGRDHAPARAVTSRDSDARHLAHPSGIATISAGRPSPAGFDWVLLVRSLTCLMNKAAMTLSTDTGTAATNSRSMACEYAWMIP